MSSEIPSAVHAEEVVAPEAKQPGADGGNQYAHWMGVVTKAFHEIFYVFVNVSMGSDLVFPVLSFGSIRKLAI